MIVIGKSAVVLDVAVRCGVIVVIGLLTSEFVSQQIEPNSDGFPERILIVTLVAYLVWNLAVIVRSSRAWAAGSIGDPSFLALLGALSLARLLWLLPLADDLWWRHRDRLMVVVVASVVSRGAHAGRGHQADDGSRRCLRAPARLGLKRRRTRPPPSR